MTRIWITLVPVLFALGCASTPVPTTAISEAESSLERALAAGGQEYAPIEIRFVQEKISGARLAASNRDGARAARLADQAMVNAELAIAKSAAARARAASRDQERSNDELREELGIEP